MALTPQNEDAFLREVDEELRRDQLGTFWRRYGRLLVVAVLLALAAFGGFLYWQHQRNQSAGAEGEQMAAVLADLGQGKDAGVTPKLDTLAASDHGGYRATALLTKAALAIDKGDTKTAIAQYKIIADDAKLAQPFRDLALIRQTTLEFETLPAATVIERMKPLAVAGNPWLGSAGELLATAYARNKQPQLAGQIYGAIAKEESVPETLRARATRMAGQLGVDAVAQPAPAATDKE